MALASGIQRGRVPAKIGCHGDECSRRGSVRESRMQGHDEILQHLTLAFLVRNTWKATPLQTFYARISGLHAEMWFGRWDLPGGTPRVDKNAAATAASVVVDCSMQGDSRLKQNINPCTVLLKLVPNIDSK